MEINHNNIKVIGFDADDTLWVNETYFREAENQFAKLLSAYETENKIDQELFKKEIENLELYGYGVKGFILSMIESALELSDNKIPVATLSKILDIGKNMLNKPVELLEGVENTLQSLQPYYKLVLITKGDLLDQERKLKKSGLSRFFHHIEVLSDKQVENYKQLLHSLEIDPEQFLMVGNSLKSDVLPLVKLNVKAVHVPFHTTWLHEQIEVDASQNKQYATISKLSDLVDLLQIEESPIIKSKDN